MSKLVGLPDIQPKRSIVLRKKAKTLEDVELELTNTKLKQMDVELAAGLRRSPRNWRQWR